MACPEDVTRTSGLYGRVKGHLHEWLVSKSCYSHEWLVQKLESRSVTRTSGLSEWLVTRTSGLSESLKVEVLLARVACPEA